MDEFKNIILQFGYYDESGKYIVVLNGRELKKMFNADIIEVE